MFNKLNIHVSNNYEKVGWWQVFSDNFKGGPSLLKSKHPDILSKKNTILVGQFLFKLPFSHILVVNLEF